MTEVKFLAAAIWLSTVLFPSQANVFHEYCVIGAGPAGLQMGYFLQDKKRDYIIFEKGWWNILIIDEIVSAVRPPPPALPAMLKVERANLPKKIPLSISPKLHLFVFDYGNPSPDR